MVPPFYYKNVADDGLLAYLDAILSATAEHPIAIYLYHFPALSGCPWHLGLIGRVLFVPAWHNFTGWIHAHNHVHHGWTNFQPSGDSKGIFVAENGDDENDGSMEHPVRTPVRAQRLARCPIRLVFTFRGSRLLILFVAAAWWERARTIRACSGALHQCALRLGVQSASHFKLLVRLKIPQRRHGQGSHDPVDRSWIESFSLQSRLSLADLIFRY